MGWSLGYDSNWNRDVGYGVPAYCDHPGCDEKINRGLAYVCCDQQMYGGEDGCGLYFCSNHRTAECTHHGFKPAPEHPDWVRHKLTHDSWQQWREEHPDEVKRMPYNAD